MFEASAIQSKCKNPSIELHSTKYYLYCQILDYG